jgi:hypothetical protein
MEANKETEGEMEANQETIKAMVEHCRGVPRAEVAKEQAAVFYRKSLKER